MVNISYEEARERVDEFFKRVRSGENRLARMAMVLEKSKSVLLSVSGIDYDRVVVQGGTDDPHFVKAYERLEQRQREYDAEYEEYLNIKDECRAIIEKSSNETVKEIYYLKYFEYDNFCTISEKMEYSIRQVTRYYKKGVNEYIDYID